MQDLTTLQFLGFECVELRSQHLSLLATKSVGPRVIGLRVLNDSGEPGPNLFAELPEATTECPGSGTFHFYGGHRLWHSPEVIERTYLPDDQPVQIEPTPDGMHVTQPIEAKSGLQKSLHIKLVNDTTIIVDHMLSNHGLWPVECAPWAITQLRPGGVAILPQTTDLADPGGLQPNRRIVLWPYSDIRSPHIHWGNQYILVQSTPKTGPLKIGFPNPLGWLAYHIDNTLFVKYATYLPGADYFDQGSSSQCYCRFDFLELETLGPRATIPPAGSTSHREIWRVFSDTPFAASESAAGDLAVRLALGAFQERSE